MAGEVEQMGVLVNRGGHVYLSPPFFLPDSSKHTPILRLCLGYSHSGQWRIPAYVSELAPVCSPEHFHAFSQELERVMGENETSPVWEYCACVCCPFTLGLSCLPKYLSASSLKRKLQAVCDRFSAAWGLPPGTLTAIHEGSNSPQPVASVGLESIPVDERGEPMLDNIGQSNVISPELLRAGICLKHARLYGTVASVNGVPVYVSNDSRLAIAPGEHLQVQRELQIIDMLDQDFVSWPPLGFSVAVRLSDPLLFQLWPRRVDMRALGVRVEEVRHVQGQAAAAAHYQQNQVAGAIMSAFRQ